MKHGAVVTTENVSYLTTSITLLVEEFREGDAGIDESSLSASGEYVSLEDGEADVGESLDLLWVMGGFVHSSISFLSIIISRYSSIPMTQKLSSTGYHSSTL